jgi:hypothetical protein
MGALVKIVGTYLVVSGGVRVRGESFVSGDVTSYPSNSGMAFCATCERIIGLTGLKLGALTDLCYNLFLSNLSNLLRANFTNHCANFALLQSSYRILTLSLQACPALINPPCTACSSQLSLQCECPSCQICRSDLVRVGGLCCPV